MAIRLDLRPGLAGNSGTPAEPAFLTSYLLWPRISVAVPDATLPRQLGNCSRRYPSSATAPALLYLGNRSCVALAPASLQSSCIPAVVVHPWNRAHIALGCVLNVVSATPALRCPCVACVPAQACLAWAFAGTSVHRTLVFIRRNHGYLRALATISGEKCGLGGRLAVIHKRRFLSMADRTATNGDSDPYDGAHKPTREPQVMEQGEIVSKKD